MIRKYLSIAITVKLIIEHATDIYVHKYTAIHMKLPIGHVPPLKCLRLTTSHIMGSEVTSRSAILVLRISKFDNVCILLFWVTMIITNVLPRNDMMIIMLKSTTCNVACN